MDKSLDDLSAEVDADEVMRTFDRAPSVFCCFGLCNEDVPFKWFMVDTILALCSSRSSSINIVMESPREVCSISYLKSLSKRSS
jgi:hypothetical protein